VSRGLVLGGGGIAGTAWGTGLLSGLAPAGVDVRDADLVVGTSAGSVVATRIDTPEWPAARFVVTAIDTADGEFLAVDRDTGWPLLDAVAASCAVPGVDPPITVGGRRLVDGGLRSPPNADLAAGCDRVLAVAPVAGPGGPLGTLPRRRAGRPAPRRRGAPRARRRGVAGGVRARPARPGHPRTRRPRRSGAGRAGRRGRPGRLVVRAPS
jgi:NTE family protein